MNIFGVNAILFLNKQTSHGTNNWPSKCIGVNSVRQPKIYFLYILITHTSNGMVVPLGCLTPSIYNKFIFTECDKYVDETGLVDEMTEVLNSALDFVLDSGVTYNPDEMENDPKKLPKTVLTECLNVLHQLGPWCAGKVATSLRRQLDKIIELVFMPEITRQFAQVRMCLKA